MLAIGVVSFWSTMGRSSVSWYATVSPSLTKAFPSNVVGWGIMVLKPLEGSLLEVEAVEGITMRGGWRVLELWSSSKQPCGAIQKRIDLFPGLCNLLPRWHLCGGLHGGGRRGDLSRVPPPSSGCCRRKNPPAGLLHCHHGLDCGRDSGRFP